MTKTILSILLSALLLFSCSSHKENKNIETSADKTFSVEQAKASLDFSVEQYKRMMAELPDSMLLRTYQGDTAVYASIYWWCSGFYPGTLWYLYEYSKDEALKNEAEHYTMMNEPIKNVTDNHDLGFMLYCSFGNGYRITQNDTYKEILLVGAESLASRFSSKVNCIKSWDWASDKGWQYPVIIDNMMNLEFLMWAAKTSGNSEYAEISKTHANTTIKNHFRDDFSSYHVIDYDSVTGDVRHKHTHQGYSDESAWARGQTWGLYGYTMMYRETKEKAYLDQAVNIAEFILNHPNLPEDKVPYWDFNAPDIPNVPRDASSASIIASALLELQAYVDTEKSEKYMAAAEHMLASLASPAYTAKPNTNGNFILMHSTGHLPGDSEVDVPLTYADYYYVEALVRFLNLKK